MSVMNAFDDEHIEGHHISVLSNFHPFNIDTIEKERVVEIVIRLSPFRIPLPLPNRMALDKQTIQTGNQKNVGTLI